jgi:transposase
MSKKNQKRRSEMLPVLHPDAAGVDIGAEELFVAVPSDRDAEPVRRFSSFTRDLLELAEWLKRCGVRTVAMESTSSWSKAISQPYGDIIISENQKPERRT